MKSFLDLNPLYSEAKFVIFPVPYDGTSSLIPGARFGPEAIISASRGLEFFDTDYNETITNAIYTMHEDEIPLRPEDVVSFVEGAVGEILDDGKIPITVGGEHTITLGAVRAFYERFSNMVVLSLDAHYDLRDEYGGYKISHASVMRRISELVPVFFMGQRVASEEEMVYFNENHNLVKGIEGLEGKDVYISVDLDVLDPSVCPSVGNPEPGGMDFKEVVGLLEEVFRKSNVLGFDIVELQPVGNPFYGAYTGAVLLKKMIIMKQRRLNG